MTPFNFPPLKALSPCVCCWMYVAVHGARDCSVISCQLPLHSTTCCLHSCNRQVAQLKDLLKEKDLPITGKKAELIERLLEAPAGGAEVSTLHTLLNLSKKHAIKRMSLSPTNPL